MGAITIAHAWVTWPVYATIALFLGGGMVAFIGEAIVVRRGWLVHHVDPKVWGVPIYVLFGWTGTVYVSLRISLMITEGLLAVVTAATLATAFDSLVDHRGVDAGFWTYTPDGPGPFRGEVPYWNFAGWFLVGGCTAALAVPFL